MFSHSALSLQPAACDGCVRSGSPCVVCLKSFVGCYECKRRSVYCSLAASINEKGFKENKPLAWWITLMQHICSVLDLATIDGPRAVLPNYADVIMEGKNIPRWVISACNRIRQRGTLKDINKRWAELQRDIIPTWKFYAMPHSLLTSMGDRRPKRPYWPNPGEEQDVIQRGIAILEKARSGSLPRIWASHAKVDGYDFSAKEDAREAKEKDSKRVIVEKHKEHARIASSSKLKKARSPVPSVTDPDEGIQQLFSSVHLLNIVFAAPVTDIEPAPVFVEDDDDVDANILSPQASTPQPVLETLPTVTERDSPAREDSKPSPGISFTSISPGLASVSLLCLNLCHFQYSFFLGIITAVREGKV